MAVPVNLLTPHEDASRITKEIIGKINAEELKNIKPYTKITGNILYSTNKTI